MTKPRREKLAELVESFHARSGSHRRENSANSMIAATYDQCADELSAILNEPEEAEPVAIPEGWKLVPKDFRKLAPHAWKPFQEIRNGNWSEDVAWEELLATAPQPPAVAWINHCDRQAISALRYLAYNDRQMAGSGSFNTEHLLQIAEELERSIAAAPRAYGSEILVDGLDNDALFALVKAGHREGDETIRETPEVAALRARVAELEGMVSKLTGERDEWMTMAAKAAGMGQDDAWRAKQLTERIDDAPRGTLSVSLAGGKLSDLDAEALRFNGRRVALVLVADAEAQALPVVPTPPEPSPSAGECAERSEA